LSFPFCYYNN